ncbi:MAG: S-layer homology domain-containing protein, partial [Chloroflexia bacterium]
NEPCNSTNDPYFRPSNNITRGQLAKVVSLSAGFNEPVTGQTFEDVAPGTTFYDFIERLASRGVMGGYPCGIDPNEPCGPGNLPYFRPGANASRGQLTKIVSNAAGFTDPDPTTFTFTDVPPGSTFHLYVERLLINRPGAMNGYPCSAPAEPCDDMNRPYFRPSNTLTRGQTSKIVTNTFFPDCAAY